MVSLISDTYIVCQCLDLLLSLGEGEYLHELEGCSLGRT